MRKTFPGIALIAFGIAAAGPMRAPAASAPGTGVTGDLVLDFMGAQRGYVEPCG